ncbi:Integrase core domain protein [compost metagenome]
MKSPTDIGRSLARQWQRSSVRLERLLNPASWPQSLNIGNCYDKAMVESFFQLLKRERIRLKTYATREEARSDVLDYIEMFYNPKRRHSSAMQLSPVEFEKRYFHGERPSSFCSK